MASNSGDTMDDVLERKQCIRTLKKLEKELKKLDIDAEDLRRFKRAIIEPIVNEAVKKTLDEMEAE